MWKSMSEVRKALADWRERLDHQFYADKKPCRCDDSVGYVCEICMEKDILQDAIRAIDATCRWTHDDEHGKWDGNCGIAWECGVGTPQEHGINFCPRCGKKVEVMENGNDVLPLGGGDAAGAATGGEPAIA